MIWDILNLEAPLTSLHPKLFCKPLITTFPPPNLYLNTMLSLNTKPSLNSIKKTV